MNAISHRSSFVTTLAWIFIVLSGFATMISLLQNAMVWTIFRQPEIAQAMAEQPQGMPPFASVLMAHFQWFFLAFLIVSSTSLASSIGLLKRMNRARLVFIAIMCLGIIWNLGGLLIQFGMFEFMRGQFEAVPKNANVPDMRPFLIAIGVVGALFAIGCSVLFGWIVKRLMSPAIKAEFGAQS